MLWTVQTNISAVPILVPDKRCSLFCLHTHLNRSKSHYVTTDTCSWIPTAPWFFAAKFCRIVRGFKHLKGTWMQMLKQGQATRHNRMTVCHCGHYFKITSATPSSMLKHRYKSRSPEDTNVTVRDFQELAVHHYRATSWPRYLPEFWQGLWSTSTWLPSNLLWYTSWLTPSQ